MNTYPFLNAWLQCLVQLAPPRGLVHIGAGGGAQPYPYANMPRLLAVEADALRHARLQTQLQNNVHCQVTQAVVAAEAGTADFHTLSQSFESGLVPAAAIQALWSNIKTLHADTVPTTTLQALLADAPGGATAFNWAMIDCLPADQLLQGAGDLIHGWDVLLVRALKDAPAGANAATQAMSLTALRQQLAPFDLEFLALEEENHPQMVRALFVRSPAQQLTKVKTTFTAALQEQTRLTTESQAALSALQAQHSSLVQEKSSLIAASEELTIAREQLTIQLDVETNAKAEALAQCSALAQKGAEAHAQCFQLAQENAKLIADNEELVRTRDQFRLQRDAEAAAKAEALAQRDQLAQDKAALAADRDEQAKLAAERQAALTTWQAQCEALTQEKSNLIAASAELTSARDQLGLQRDAETKAKAEALAQRDQLAQDKATLTAARDEQAKLAAERQAALTTLQAHCEALTQEKSNLIAASAELTSARDQLGLQLDVETKAKAEALTQCGVLAQKSAELHAQRFQAMQENEKLVADNKDLVRARDQFCMQRDAETAAKAEALVQRDQLAQEQVALLIARDEQSKLAAERQAALVAQQQDASSKQQRLQQLETENQEHAMRQQMLQEELIKAEAQIELIKDLLLREPGL